jgi:hypothetical protein
MEAFNTLPDPQTNGGLLIAVNENAVDQLKKVFEEFGLNNFLSPIGRMIKAGDKVVMVNKNFSCRKHLSVMKKLLIYFLHYINMSLKLLNAQERIEQYVKAGTRLMYRIDLNNRSYDMRVTVKSLSPLFLITKYLIPLMQKVQ